MVEERPKWPESLPPPIEISEGTRRVDLVPDQLGTDEALQDLVHDLYWFSDSEYFVYFVYGEGIGQNLHVRLNGWGIETKKTEMYFYKHPKPAYENDFVRAVPGENVPAWVKEAVNVKMYGRVKLELSVTMRKQLDLSETAWNTSAAISNSDPVIEAKPNFFGMGINLNSLWRKVKKWFQRKESA
ncbi:hypothetical protein [Thiohalophilus sp.]|uniref:hypothetical protein n=1 Tax=Thiohalophilus sp. TaxID=3028392 RepID=UPI002ACE2B19|nr:hypothetical protein [Thiohalophilus sp.]MDZ7660930.1 hypothetical protein [Thiohalophilus sp.]